ncbi:MAG: hypothetical protein AAGJ38_06290 [Planctomycetota bacterium]
MNKTNAPPEAQAFARFCRGVLCLLLLLLSACGSPPSVVPVLRVVEQAMLDEADRLKQFDTERDQQLLDYSRERLRQAYLADLQSRQTLDPAWIESATDVYVAAREALAWQEIDLARQRQTRQDNLRDAAEAQAQAIAILQQQDRLFQQTVGIDLWQVDFDREDIRP